jgi:hypothetical protein
MILGHGLERVTDYSHGLDGFKDTDFLEDDVDAISDGFPHFKFCE